MFVLDLPLLYYVAGVSWLRVAGRFSEFTAKFSFSQNVGKTLIGLSHALLLILRLLVVVRMLIGVSCLQYVLSSKRVPCERCCTLDVLDPGEV